jgi:hypothetical protein
MPGIAAKSRANDAARSTEYLTDSLMAQGMERLGVRRVRTSDGIEAGGRRYFLPAMGGREFKLESS